MKKRIVLMAVTIMLALTLAGPASAFAAEEASVQALSTGQGQVDPQADEFITYYRTVDGVWQYRIWNATKGKWVTPWIVCPGQP